MRELFGRVVTWIEQQPDWARPILYGGVAVPAFAVLRGGLVLVPFAAIVALVRREPVATELLLVGLAFALAIIGGVLSGATYSLVGQHVRKLSVLGPYLAGWLSCWPYVLVLLAILRLEEATPLTAPLTRLDLMVLGGMTFWVGLLVGHFFLRTLPEK